MAACLNAVEKHWAMSMARKGHDWRTLGNLAFVKARPGFLQANLKLEAEHLNNYGTLHGGVILSLTDTVTSLTLATSGLKPPTGVSVNMSAEFLRPGGKLGDTIVCEGEVVKLGRTLASTRVHFYNSEDPKTRKLLAMGSHTKHVEKSWERQGGVLVKFSPDGETILD